MEKKEENEQEVQHNWSESVEDLVAAGDTETAISLLDSVISKLQNTKSSGPDPQLVSALSDLAKLYSSKGFSLKADEIESEVSLLKLQQYRPIGDAKNVIENLKEHQILQSNVKFRSNNSVQNGSCSPSYSEQLRSSMDVSAHDGPSDDDWEAVADRAPNELFSSQTLFGVAELSLNDNKAQKLKRRGRGTFSYKKHDLYSDQESGNSIIDGIEKEGVSFKLEENLDLRSSQIRTRHSAKYGTRHVLVLADFLPSTRTTDLEKYFEEFKDHEFVIRWVNDTVALAVFRTPSAALEVSSRIRYPFIVRVLDEDDVLLDSIAPKDLEPPRTRPRTSARTAQRLIAQGMGLKLPSTAFRSEELKKQESERRTRIVTRQKLRDEAWGTDDTS